MRKFFAVGLMLQLVMPNCVNAAESNLVKKSTNGYCHYKTSDFYSRTMNFEPYDSLSACIASGGKFPPTNKETNTSPVVKMSRTMICHDKDSAFYEQTKNFVAFESLEACRAHGGK